MGLRLTQRNRLKLITWFNSELLYKTFNEGLEMIQSIGFCQFQDSFNSIRPDNFSYEGLKALYEWLEELEEDTGETVELDVVALCCKFSEYESAVSCVKQCGYDFPVLTNDDVEDKEDELLECLRDSTTVIEFDGGIIIQNF